MTKPLLPFEITNVRDDIGGKTVFFTVGKRVIVNNKQTQTTMESAIFVDEGKDIEQTLYEALKVMGWIV